MGSLSWLLGYWWVLVLIAVIVAYKPVLRLLGVIVIPDDAIGMVTKKFVLFGANKELPPGKIIALRGEAGIQADTLAPGLHFFYWPWQYKVEVEDLTVIPAGQIGVVESCDGHPLPDGRIIGREVECDNFQDARAFLTNNGERGPQMAIIPPGTWRINKNVFTIRTASMTIVPKGMIGVVEARDGKPLSGGRVLGKVVDCDLFQNAQLFLENGGERGPQMRIVPEGTYRINPVLFNIEMAEVTEIPDNMIGVVTTKEGKQLPSGEIAGKIVEDHESFQSPQSFVNNGGFKGLQVDVLRAGRYFTNPRFATVELKPMTDIPIAHVGVVIAYVGEEGRDVTGDAFKHGNLVSKGQKGVWVEPLDPGKYPINPYTHKVELVPTANVVLNWATGKTEAHNLDKNLSTITVRSSDGFKFNMDVSQIIHIPRSEAPKVIARFGNMSNLVTQVLEPTIGNDFRNAAQSSDVIDFLNKRVERQNEAKDRISNTLKEYNVVAVDTLIGDIVPPDDLMKTLTDRKIAQQQRVTFETQREAQVVRKDLQQATAMADTQPEVVTAERKVQIAEFTASAKVKTAEGDAKSKTINAGADAEVLKMVGDAEGVKILAVGTAEADVIKRKTEAMDPDKYAMVEVARALAGSGFKLVPEIVASGGGEGASGGSLVNILLAQLVANNAPKSEAKPAKADSDK